jgi:hypothetical protein
VTLRAGDRAAAAVLRSRGHEDAAGREWARWSFAELRLDQPGRVVQRLGPRELADVLAAWGVTRTIDAMPNVASFVDDPRRSVREAARGALRDYGQNALWQAREQTRLRLGTDADPSWGWQRSMNELFRALDERRSAGIRELGEQARQALEAGDADGAMRALDALLLRAPDSSDPQLAALAGRIGDAMLAQDRLEQAHRAYARAMRASESASEMARWRARDRFVEAEAALSRGVLDLELYEQTALADRTCERCVEVANALASQAESPGESGSSSNRRAAVYAATVLLALMGVVLAFWRSRAPRSDAPSLGADAADATSS